MVLLKCPIDGPSSTSTSHQGGLKTVDATHPQGVRLYSLDVTQPLQVSLETDDGALSMTVERIGSDGNYLASFLADAESKLPAGMTGGKSKWSSEWAIYGKQNRLHLVLRPMRGQIRAESRPMRSQIRAESRIPLQDGTALTFEMRGESAIVPTSGAKLTVLDRKLKLEGKSLVLDGLKGVWIGLDPGAKALNVSMNRGKSDRILLDDSNEATTTLAEQLMNVKKMATYLGMVTLIGSTILAILTGLKLIKKE
jgi:hypothetical protein